MTRERARRMSLVSIVLALALSGRSSSSVHTRPSPERPRNIVFTLSDDHRDDPKERVASGGMSGSVKRGSFQANQRKDGH